jgi:hypothetical protein
MDSDREKLIENAKGFWVRLASNRPVEEANKLTDESDSIVDHWAKSGLAEPLLSPLLEHSAIEVRYLAAAKLAVLGLSEAAWSVLEEISIGPYGLISSSAELLLMNRHQD